MCNLRVRKCLADESELLIRDGKVLEIVFDRTTKVRMVVHQLLSVVCSQPKVLCLEFAADGVLNFLRCRAGEDIREILAMESTLDGTRSHAVFDYPIVVLIPLCGNSSVVSLDRSRNTRVGSRESGWGVRWKASFSVLNNLLALQVCRNLLLPLEVVVLRKGPSRGQAPSLIVICALVEILRVLFSSQ